MVSIKDSYDNVFFCEQDMSIKKITIQPGCISCGLCAFIAPEVFEVTDISRVKESVNLNQYEQKIEDAAAQCPVRVISYTKEEVSDDTSKTK